MAAVSFLLLSWQLDNVQSYPTLPLSRITTEGTCLQATGHLHPRYIFLLSPSSVPCVGEMFHIRCFHVAVPTLVEKEWGKHASNKSERTYMDTRLAANKGSMKQICSNGIVEMVDPHGVRSEHPQSRLSNRIIGRTGQKTSSSREANRPISSRAVQYLVRCAQPSPSASGATWAHRTKLRATPR